MLARFAARSPDNARKRRLTNQSGRADRLLVVAQTRSRLGASAGPCLATPLDGGPRRP
jgi:hypothetical protein